MPSTARTARTATKGLARLYSAENKPRFGGFEAFEHTHKGIVATGDSLAEALSWAAIGIFSIIDDLEIVQFKSEIKVSVSSANSESLVIDWLNELLALLRDDRKVAGPADEIVAQVICSSTSYVQDPIEFDRHRRRLLELAS